MHTQAEPKKELVSINPANGETVGTLAQTTVKEVSQKVKAANKVWHHWRTVGLQQRTEILKQAQHLLLEQSESVARLISAEMGRPFIESLVMEVEATIDLIDYYTGKSHKLLTDRSMSLHNLFFKRKSCYLHHQPLGVFAVISPWNWPLLIPMGTIIPALLAGNCIVFKHSEITPLVGRRIEELLCRAGIPKDVFQSVCGQGQTGQALIASDVAKIFFTGSTLVGRKVMQQAAASLKKCVLELGGNDPALVCEDADIDNSSSGIVWGALNNCGQNCNSIERVYVNKKIADDFIKLLINKTKVLRLGNGMNSNTDIGPLASEQQLNKIKTIVEQATKEGHKLLCGGEVAKSMNGYFFQPTLFLREARALHPLDQEIFGPVLFVTPVDDDEQAIQLANTSNFGLSASVWTQNIQNGRRIASDLACGNVMINDCIVSFGFAELSWSGVKQSGIGWVHGEKGLDEMVNIQYITIEKQSHIQKFWWFPYSSKMIRAIQAGLDFLFAPSLRKKIVAIPTLLQHFSGYFLKNSKKAEKL